MCKTIYFNFSLCDVLIVTEWHTNVITTICQSFYVKDVNTFSLWRHPNHIRSTKDPSEETVDPS